MDYLFDNPSSSSMEEGSQNITTESDIDYGSSSEVANPHPATATPAIPSEMPVREGKPAK